MPEFTDSTGQKWEVRVTGGTVKRASEKLGVDIGEPLAGDPPLLTRFDIDIAFKVDLLFVVCMPEAEKREVSDVDFAELLEGDALYHASEAFTEAWALFFRSLHRPHHVAAVEKQREQIRKIWDAGAELVNSEAMAEKLQGDLEELGSSFANSLQSSDVRPSPERSGS
jgi:hypothetical protein